MPRRAIPEAADMLAELAGRHDFTFYKYQIPDLVSHTGKVDLARDVFAVIEEFVERLLSRLDPAENILIVTSDHGHLEQVASSHAHPKTRVPTWYFGTDAEASAARLRRPEDIFHLLVERSAVAK